MMNSGTASGRLSPQSHAAATQIRSGPRVSSMSTARAGETFVTGYSVSPVQNPLSRIMSTVCSSAWSTITRCGSIRWSAASVSTITFVPFHLSSRCGVWMWISCSCSIARSTWSLKPASSLRVTRLRPISPIPSTVGISRYRGMTSSTWRVSSRSSASFGFRHIHVKWAIP